MEGITSHLDEAVSPRDRTTLEQAMESLATMSEDLNPLESVVADPDAQATVTDYLDFTEHLPADIIRSMTLIGKLDKKYRDAHDDVNKYTTQWGELPELPAEQRPRSDRLRADISDSLGRAVSTRVYSYAEARRIQEAVTRHYNRIQYILSKLQHMHENFVVEEPKSPAAVKSPQATRAPKAAIRISKSEKIRRQRVPMITVPGEVLAPFEVPFDYSDSDISSDESEDEVIERSATPPRRSNTRITPAAKIAKTPKPKVPKEPKTQKESKVPKIPKSAARPTTSAAPGTQGSAATSVPLVPPLSQLKPPPEDAEIGSEHRPWLRLTAYELAKLRKRMKKNAHWTPSETMVARELKILGRGPEEYNAAKKKAEEEGKPFESTIPVPVVDAVSGDQKLPVGAISPDTLKSSKVSTSNRGMKLNEAKKIKRELLAKQAADEAEESARKMREFAMNWSVGLNQPSTSPVEGSSSKPKPSKSSSKPKKRKRDSVSEADTEKPAEGAESAAPGSKAKRAKTEATSATSSSSQQYTIGATEKQHSLPPHPTPIHPPQLTPGGTVVHSQTPVPIPLPPHHTSHALIKNSASPPEPAEQSSAIAAATTSPISGEILSSSIPTVVRATIETPIPLPLHSPKKPETPIFPPTHNKPSKQVEKKSTENNGRKVPPPLSIIPATVVVSAPPPSSSHKSSSRAATPKSATPVPELTQQPVTQHTTRRPPSRGVKAASQEPPSGGLAADRPRRASTARNTPAPDATGSSLHQQQGQLLKPKRAKLPAPGVVNNGSNSAIGRRKAAPKKRTRTSTKKGTSADGKGGGLAGQMFEVMVEVDDDGNVIDPDEPRYCLCDQVSFGTMIQCENVDVSLKSPSSPMFESPLSGSCRKRYDLYEFEEHALEPIKEDESGEEEDVNAQLVPERKKSLRSAATSSRSVLAKKRAIDGSLKDKTHSTISSLSPSPPVTSDRKQSLRSPAVEAASEASTVESKKKRGGTSGSIPYPPLPSPPLSNKKRSLRGASAARSKKPNVSSTIPIITGNVTTPPVERNKSMKKNYANQGPVAKPQNCKGEWFHLECVGLTDIPARTTKWYCPECRHVLKIGEKGEVNSRGMRA